MDPYAFHLAVVSGKGDKSDRLFDLARGEFHGTAFAIAPSLFLTAAHVYDDASAAPGKVALARLTSQQQVEFVEDAEVFPRIDLALLRCSAMKASTLPISVTPLWYLDDVAAFGFAFGLRVSGGGDPHIFALRAFKGHVVTRRGLTELPGVPPGYEVSFIPPPGLSGAALLLLKPQGPVVSGVVLKHHKAELEERKMELGLALDIEEILTLDSRIVGGSIAERIFKRERVPARDGTP